MNHLFWMDQSWWVTKSYSHVETEIFKCKIMLLLQLASEFHSANNYSVFLYRWWYGRSNAYRYNILILLHILLYLGSMHNLL